MVSDVYPISDQVRFDARLFHRARPLTNRDSWVATTKIFDLIGIPHFQALQAPGNKLSPAKLVFPGLGRLLLGPGDQLNNPLLARQLSSLRKMWRAREIMALIFNWPSTDSGFDTRSFCRGEKLTNQDSCVVITKNAWSRLYFPFYLYDL